MEEGLPAGDLLLAHLEVNPTASSGQQQLASKRDVNTS